MHCNMLQKGVTTKSWPTNNQVHNKCADPYHAKFNNIHTVETPTENVCSHESSNQQCQAHHLWLQLPMSRNGLSPVMTENTLHPSTEQATGPNQGKTVPGRQGDAITSYSIIQNPKLSLLPGPQTSILVLSELGCCLPDFEGSGTHHPKP